MSLQSMFAGAVAGICVLGLAGCGGPVEVQGKVTMNGQPLSGATVVFVPEGGGPEAGAQRERPARA